VDQVFVSTDDQAIAEIALEAKAEIIQRPAETASDEASSEAALLHALGFWRHQGRRPDIVIFLQCTSPLRRPEDIDAAVEQLLKNQADSLLSVAPTHRFLWTQGNDGHPQSINFDYRHRKRRQDSEPQYVENGSIYIFKPWVLEKGSNRLGGNIEMYVMPEHTAFEIDSEFDFNLIEFIMKEKGYYSDYR
jgi:N-acylneuraminate cytidylyltransferase